MDNFWKGQLAHARVYKRALSQEEIAELMLDDQTAASAFKRGHPLEFSVYDDDQQPVLVISDGQPDRRLHVEIANSSQRTIELAPPLSPTPSPDNYHFELKFRPGTLSASARAQLGLAAEQKGWAVSRAQQADGTFSVYFLNPAPTDGAALQPGQSVVLTLQNVGAEGGGGSRGTRVELRYSQLKYVGEVAQIEGSRVQHLEIINERGKRNIPLHVGFLGPNRVLNDGHTPNELRLRITNSLGESSIPLAPKTSDAPSTFIISFDVQADGEQREWALATSGDVQHVEVNAVMTEGGKEVADASWIATKNAEGESPEWELTTPDKTSLGPGEMIQLKLSSIVSSLPSGQTNLYVRYKNLPGYWDGQFVVSAEKLPLVFEGQSVGVGTNKPRSALDTGKGVMTGAANDYQKAQATLSGGGTVTWRAEPVAAGARSLPAGRLKWTQRFIAISMGGLHESFANGCVSINPPTADIPAGQVWDGSARSVNANGVLLKDWEALYAEHTVGGGDTAVKFHVVLYTTPFVAPSNWLIVALRNDDDQTLKLGTGVCLSLNSSSTKGSPVPTGTIMMWSGDENNIPDGWALCNGRSDIPGLRVPDLTGRFIVGAGPSGNPVYKAGQFAEADQHAHDIIIPQYTFTTTQNGGHNHAPPGDWYDRDLLGDVSALGLKYHNAIDRGSPSVKSVRTSTDGNHAHSVTVVIPRLGGEQALPRPPKVEQWQVLSTPPSVSATTQASTSTSAQASASTTPASKTPVAQAPPPAVAPTWQNRPRWFALCYIMKL